MDKRRARDEECGTPEKRSVLREAMSDPISARYDFEGAYSEVTRAAQDVLETFEVSE